MNLTIGTKIKAGFAIAFAVVFFVQIAYFRNADEIKADAAWVTHTFDVLQQLQNLMAGLSEAESAERAYIITGDTAFEAAVKTAEARINHNVSTLRTLTADNPAQQRRIIELEPVISLRLETLERKFELLKANEGKMTAQVENLFKEGGRLMGDARRLVAEMENDEQALLVARQKRAKAAVDSTSGTVVLSMLVSLALLGITSALVKRSITKPLKLLGYSAAKIGGGDYGHRVAPLDVTDERAAQAAVLVAVDALWRLDVVVNNAGYGDVAPFERLSSERFKALMDTNFYGVVYMTRAALPVMRKQRSGCILQISSVGGRLTRPGNAGYHAAKWAVGGFTESVAKEVAPFGVKMCALEPAGIRTNWGVRANENTPDLLPDYEPSVGAVINALKPYWGKETSDPVKVAQVVLRLAESDQLPAHLLLGSDAVQYAGQAEATRAADAERWREVSVSTDVNASRALPALRF